MAKYIAMWNMPGYLPEMEPFETDSFKEAREFIADELDCAGDNCNSDDSDRDRFLRAADYCRTRWLTPEEYGTPVMPDGYCYSIKVMER